MPCAMNLLTGFSDQKGPSDSLGKQGPYFLVFKAFIFATGELEMVKLPETSPWADKYGAGPRVRLPDVVDAEKGQVSDAAANRGPSWGREERPGMAQIYVFPNARDGRVIADVVRLDKGHTEGLEPKITEELIKMMVAAPGGKLMVLARSTSAIDKIKGTQGKK